MERWLSKSRVMLGLCLVLLVAALNRQSPTVYGMFLLLATISLLGFVMPWLSLRSMTMRLDDARLREVTEGQGCDLSILVQRTAPWPAFMVDIETEWKWASQRIVLRQTLPVIRSGRAPQITSPVWFPCRGLYELVTVRMSSGFPLGLARAQHTLRRPDIFVRVLPVAQAVQWPLPWDVAEDPLGELTTRRLGQSFELGILRAYQQGESVGRVNWRASARAGELVIQHFQQSGSIRLRLVLDVPRWPGVGDPYSAGEQAVRLAVGVADAALLQGAQLHLYLPGTALRMHDGNAVREALAGAAPPDESMHSALARALASVAEATVQGEQVAVVVSSACAFDLLQAPLSAVAAQGCQVVVCIATGPRASPEELAQAQALEMALVQAGFAVYRESP